MPRWRQFLTGDNIVGMIFGGFGFALFLLQLAYIARILGAL